MKNATRSDALIGLVILFLALGQSAKVVGEPIELPQAPSQRLVPENETAGHCNDLGKGLTELEARILAYQKKSREQNSALGTFAQAVAAMVQQFSDAAADAIVHGRGLPAREVDAMTATAAQTEQAVSWVFSNSDVLDQDADQITNLIHQCLQTVHQTERGLSGKR